MPLAINPTTGEIILLQMDGKMTREEFIHALDLAFAKVPEIREKQIEALREFFRKSSASLEEGNGNNSFTQEVQENQQEQKQETKQE